MSKWLGTAMALHRRAAVGTVTLACLAALSPPGLSAQAAVLLAGVTLVGMPHGAFDHLVAARVLRPRLGTGWWAPFLAGYVALAGLVWIGWIFVPALTLVAFLALSVLHFGLGDTEGDRAGIAGVIARGAMPILLPAVSHPAAVAPMFAALASSDTATLLPDAPRSPLADRAMGLAGRCLGREPPPHGSGWKAAATCAAFALLPPLLAFALYFCVCHSLRHLLRLGAMLNPDDGRAAWFGVLRTGGTCRAPLRGPASAALATQGMETTMVPLFRILAALTLPHMAVTLWLENRAEAALGTRATATSGSDRTCRRVIRTCARPVGCAFAFLQTAARRRL